MMFKCETMFGSYMLELEKKQYADNGNLAIQAYCNTEGFREPFARLTVNLGRKLADDVAYVDTNNCPWAEEFIEENGLGVPTDRIGQSGWCFYPQYKFDLSKIGGAS